MKFKTAIACLTIGLLTSLLIVTTPLFAQESPPSFLANPVVSEQDNQILARVTSQEGIPTSPELKSQVDEIVELEGFGSIAYRKPLKSSSEKATPFVLFHNIFGGVSHRNLRELLSSHILHLKIWMSNPQLRARRVNRLISSKRRDTTCEQKKDSRAV
ncbi:MAG: hypothetical protein MJK14_18890, partial [Rivularia sp. ALOHA_DT_140]|nr:hypothetical protein [Rivularia sp. ALOHA_DT_140]